MPTYLMIKLPVHQNLAVTKKIAKHHTELKKRQPAKNASNPKTTHKYSLKVSNEPFLQCQCKNDVLSMEKCS